MYCDGRRVPMSRGAVPAGVVVLLLALVAGCASSGDRSEMAYRGAEGERSLRVPPDLTRPESPAATRVPVLDERRQVLPRFDHVELVRVGGSSWLRMPGSEPDEVWGQLLAFLRTEGLEVRSQQPATGVIETRWARRYDSPRRGGVAGFFDQVFGRGDTGIEDRYQFRLERDDASGGTRVFVAHWMAEDQRRGGTGRDRHHGFEWRQASGDPAVISEVQRRFLVYMGMRQRQAERVLALDGTVGISPHGADYEAVDGVGSVVVGTDAMADAWVRMGDALGRIGAIIDDTDADRGIYRVRWMAPGEQDRTRGLFAIFRGGDDNAPHAPRAREFVLQARAEEGRARIVAAPGDAAFDPAGEGVDGVPQSGRVEQALLQRLTDALNGTFVHGVILADTRDEEAARGEGGTRGRRSGGTTGPRGY